MTALTHIKARDIMRTDVVAFSATTSIQSAVNTFEELHISGAPVLDESGHILGMLSKTDIARPEHLQGDAIQTERGDNDMLGSEEAGENGSFDELITARDDYSAATLGSSPVVDWMSTEKTVAVAPDWSLAAVCRAMITSRVHRVPVLEDRKIVGIISTLDVVRCVAENLSPRATESRRTDRKHEALRRSSSAKSRKVSKRGS